MDNLSLQRRPLISRGEVPHSPFSPPNQDSDQSISPITSKFPSKGSLNASSLAETIPASNPPNFASSPGTDRRSKANDTRTIPFPDRRNPGGRSSWKSGEDGVEIEETAEIHGSSFRIPTDYGRLQVLMEDPEIEEIWLNSPNRIFYAKSGVSQLSNLVMTVEEVRGLIERLLMWGGRRLDLTNPFVDARLPDGSRLHVAIPEVTAKNWAINIRKHLVRGNSLAELVDLGVMNSEVKDFLTECVLVGKNLLVSGSTQAGKTTLLNALVSAVPNKSRVITIEEVFELRPRVADCVALQTRSPNLQGEGEIPLRRLIKEALRMRPSRLVVGEIREAESLDLLIALNSGLPGAATIHANSAQDAIAKLQTLPLLAGENISHRFITPVVASAIDVVVHISLNSSGRRTVTQVLALTGRVEGDRIETEPIFTLFQNSKDSSPEYIRGIGQVEGIKSGDLLMESTHSRRARG